MIFSRLLTSAILLGGLCATCAAEDTADSASAVETRPVIHILTKDGRRLSGRLACDSNSEQLRLVLATPSIIVTTCVPTSNIRTIVTPTGELSREELLERLHDFRIENHWTVSTPLDRRLDSTRSGRSSHSELRSSRTVAAISITARLVNWDRDEALDGLLLELTPLDALGRPIAAAGQLDAELVGLYRPLSGGRSSADDQRQENMPLLESWHVTVDRNDSENVVALKLPFRHFDPEKSPDVTFVGLLRVRFGVPSVGVFEASVSDVVIREPSLFREELFLSTGSRLLPRERP